MSFKAIARELGKDCTTISKEIRNHLVFKKSGALGKPFNDCALRFDCDIFQVCQPCVNRSGRPCKFCGRCLSFCISYKKETCSRLSKPPYVCNGCEKKRNCTLIPLRFRDLRNRTGTSGLCGQPSSAERAVCPSYLSKPCGFYHVQREDALCLHRQ